MCRQVQVPVSLAPRSCCRLLICYFAHPLVLSFMLSGQIGGFLRDARTFLRCFKYSMLQLHLYELHRLFDDCKMFWRRRKKSSFQGGHRLAAIMADATLHGVQQKQQREPERAAGILGKGFSVSVARSRVISKALVQ